MNANRGVLEDGDYTWLGVIGIPGTTHKALGPQLSCAQTISAAQVFVCKAIYSSLLLVAAEELYLRFGNNPVFTLTP